MALLFNLLLILLIARDLAHLTWDILWPTTAVIVTTSQHSGINPQTINPRTTNPRTTTPQHLATTPDPLTAALGLFGHNNTAKNSQPPAQTIPNTPQTTLPLRLVGIIFANDQTSLALIALPGQREKIYHIGDSLPGQARLHTILTDRVILQRQNKYETLRLPKDTKNVKLRRGGTAYLSIEANAEVIKIWQQFRKRPESMLQLMRLEPAMKRGKLIGVQIFPGRNKKFLSTFGLQAGDIITWVNGIELTDQLKGMEAIGKLATQNALHFRLQRNSVSYTFDFYLDGKPPRP